jgi:hypothetical protein
MKKRYIIVVFLLAFYFICTVQAYGSRVYAPSRIPPIIYKDIKIVAENSSPDNMGIVQAFNVKTNKLIWSTKVYGVKIEPGIEEDTQWIFIKEIKINNDKLLVVNEKNKTFQVDPNTGRVLHAHNNSINNIVIAVIVLFTIILCIVILYNSNSNISIFVVTLIILILFIALLYIFKKKIIII